MLWFVRAIFDWVAAECLSKAFALSRAALLLIESGFPDEGYATSRSLVEYSVNLDTSP
jgi:hypothetical protein